MIFMAKSMVSGEDFPLNQSILVGGLDLYGIILPIDFHIFQRGSYTTNQLMVKIPIMVNHHHHYETHE